MPEERSSAVTQAQRRDDVAVHGAGALLLVGAAGTGKTELVARRFEMAGGYIKKAALRAALIAADAKRAVTTADLLEAARLEYREMGRII